MERLADRYRVTLYFYNPNITDREEYEKRREAQKTAIEKFNGTRPEDSRIRLVEGPYDPTVFFEAVKGYEQEPENGSRCDLCFRLRLEQTAKEADRGGFDEFATTLSVSPHKNTERINAIGYELEKNVKSAFLDESFKKKDGFRRSVQMSKEYGLYRQNYCGCVFSFRPPDGGARERRNRGEHVKYVRVIIDNTSNHTDNFYTYACEEDGIQPGAKVRVPFGRGNRLKDAYVFSVQPSPDPAENLDPSRIEKVVQIDENLSLTEDLLRLCVWMRRTYLCRYIDAIRCMIPPGGAAKRGKRRDPREEFSCDPDTAPGLTVQQREAMARILPCIEGEYHSTFLLNGVTSSGKTEIYLRTAEEVLSRGKQVIVLVPEISLAPQTIGRFIGRFGAERVAVLHSRLTKGQRYDQWMQVRNGKADILIGARLGVFAPFERLGALIVDEEHESSYKSDMTPKYDAVDAAVERGKIDGAVVILGTATPSVVSKYRAFCGEYSEILLTERYNKTPLPNISIADMRKELRSGNRSIVQQKSVPKIPSGAGGGKAGDFFPQPAGVCFIHLLQELRLCAEM